MTYGTPTWVDSIQAAIVEQLVSSTNLPRDRVLESLAEDQDHLQFPPADQFLTCRPVSFPVCVPSVAGAGRVITGFDATWRVAVFHRYLADQELRDTRKLRSATTGVLVLVRKVISALQMFSPVSPDNPEQAIVRVPIRLRSFDLQTRPIRAGSSWTCTPTLWEVKFAADL